MRISRALLVRLAPPGRKRLKSDGRCQLSAISLSRAPRACSTSGHRKAGIAGALGGGWGTADKLGATGLGVAVPLALHGLALATGNRGNLSRIASALVLGGSFLLRVSTMGAGNKSARTPETSFRFAQPDNLPPG